MPNRDLETGQEAETDYVGSCPEMLRCKGNTYEKYGEILKRLVEAKQKGIEFRQPGQKLIPSVLESLRSKLPMEVKKVDYIPAVGSALDVFHGVDGFFLFETKKPNRVLIPITLDFTINEKKDSCKADVLLTPDDKPEVLMQDILRKLKSRLIRVAPRVEIHATLTPWQEKQLGLA